MEEINLIDMYHYFKRNIKYIALIIFSILLIGIIYSYIIKIPEYKSKTSIILINDSEITAQLDVSRINTYKEIIKSRKVLEKAILNLNITYPLEKLLTELEVNSINNTELININVKNVNNVLAKNLANSISEVFLEEIKENYGLQYKVLDYAIISQYPYNINHSKDIISFLILAFIISFIFFFLKFIFSKENELYLKK